MTDLRCSVVTAALGERPAGSATSARRFVLVELPLPWPKPIGAHPLLASVDIMSTPGVRVLAIADETDRSDGHRVLVYDRVLRPTTDTPQAAGANAMSFAGYALSETTVPTSSLAEHVTAAITATEPSTDDESALAHPKDLLICTQGTHDRCCGSFGMELYGELVADALDVRVWRTSHTGGHRFAPTGMTFPDGLMWAGLDRSNVAGIIDRSLEPAQVDALLRGCSGVDSSVAQVADAAALVSAGWTWVTEPRSVVEEDTEEAANGSPVTQVRLNGAHPTGRKSHLATLEPGPSVPVPPCAKEIELATKSSKQWRLTSLSTV